MNIQDFDAFAENFAGVLGAAVSVHYLRGSWRARLSMAVSGSLGAYYAAPYLSGMLGIPGGLAGFLTGMFGMALVSRAWEAVQAAPVAALWQAVIDRVRGNGT
ncbi:hypothetical protein [Achromobacter arsenitoxydans]|uniref:Uncharacterized protein n=1 Tax=Achromobacter arsenitoxydans SY8 TaxID=477184 RepID=H0F6W2_9BURK|nr:hypothetical protein [Achromobacter arsenitoxydans]EHK66020.1 hypothetical protein KYC_12863 [Achromobacter arsenitoxydans SY8]